MKRFFNQKECLTGLLIYAAGDTCACLILQQFMWMRLAGMMLLGATLYAWEIPAWFSWIDRRTVYFSRGIRLVVTRTFWALVYFNPLWIARHLAFIAVFSRQFETLHLSLFQTAALSWLVNIPISIIGNAVVQGVMPLKWRFVGSATFSGLLAVYYALSGIWFHG